MITMQAIHTILMRFAYPSSKEELLRQAVQQNVPTSVIEQLSRLPENMYGSLDSVMDALRGLE
ncbi:MAG TPA: DUF2795 domain-containing protein [Armatimonadota bacterium]|jgi:hypothetical protein